MNLLESLFRCLVARSCRKRGNRRTDKHTHEPSTVTLAVHVRRGLISERSCNRAAYNNVTNPPYRHMYAQYLCASTRALYKLMTLHYDCILSSLTHCITHSLGSFHVM